MNYLPRRPAYAPVHGDFYHHHPPPPSHYRPSYEFDYTYPPPRDYYPPYHLRSPSPPLRLRYPHYEGDYPRYEGYNQVWRPVERRPVSPIRPPIPLPALPIRPAPKSKGTKKSSSHPRSKDTLPSKAVNTTQTHNKTTASNKRRDRSPADEQPSTSPKHKRQRQISSRRGGPKRQRSESPDPSEGEGRPPKRPKGDDEIDELVDTDAGGSKDQGPKTNTGAASRLGVEPLTKIFKYLYEDTIGQSLCKMPLDARKAGTVVSNKRLSHGEMEAYKKVMKKRLMLDMSLICRGWFDAAGEILKGEFFVIGEKDAERAIANPKGWFPFNSRDYTPMQLTVQCTLPTLMRLIQAIHTAAEQCLPAPTETSDPDENGSGPPKYECNFLPGPIPEASYNPRDLRRARKANGLLAPLQKLHKSTRPLPIKRLTILHSFQPENLNGIAREQFYNAISLIKPEQLYFEWFAGETILTSDCINKVANRLRVPLTSEELKRGVTYHFPELEEVDSTDPTLPHNQEAPSGEDARSWHHVKSVREGVDKEDSEYEQYARYRDQQFMYADPTKRRTWKAANQMGSVMMREILGEVWRADLKSVDVRANWLDLCKTLRVAAQHNGLEAVIFRYVPLVGRPFRRATQTNTLEYHAPAPPLGSLKSLDNILMWDLRGRDPKWKRRRDHKAAKLTNTTYVEPTRVDACSFTVLAPYDLWKQQKDRSKFKGQGKQAAFGLDFNEQMYAMRAYILDKGKKWIRPDGIDEHGHNREWTEKKTFEGLIDFVTTRSRCMPKPKAKIKGHLLSITGGDFVDGAWIIKHMDRQGRLAAWEAARLARDEEEEMNDPNPVKRQEKYNFDYMMRWLVEMGSEGRKVVLEDLRKKFGAKNLWEGCNWGLKHDAFPGMVLKVQVVPK